MKARSLFIFCLLISFTSLTGASDLVVLTANPQGRLDSLNQLDAIQIMFSEAMVNTMTGEGNSVGMPGFITIEPQLPADCYWGSDRLLKIVPKDKEAIPPGTEYKVTVKEGARSLSGNLMAFDYYFSFQTPGMFIRKVDLMRVAAEGGARYRVAIQFSMSVEREAVLKCLQVGTEPRSMEFSSPALNPRLAGEIKKRDGAALRAFEEKARSVMSPSRHRGSIMFHAVDPKDEELAKWIKHRLRYDWGFSEDRLLVIETDTAVPDQSLVRVTVDPKKCSVADLGLSAPISATGFGESALFLSGFDHRRSNDGAERYTVDDYCALRFTKMVPYSEVAANISALDLTTGAQVQFPPWTAGSGSGQNVSLETLGFEPVGGHTYLFKVSAALKAADSEELGYDAYALAEFTLGRAYVSFGEGEGVWESSRGTMVPFYAKNVRKVLQSARPVSVDEVVPLLKGGFDPSLFGDAEGEEREIKGLKPDKVFNAGLELKPHLNEEGKGLVFARVKMAESLPGAPTGEEWYWEPRSAVIQVTDLGITMKYSPEDCFVYVNSLSRAEPVPGCQVEVRDMQNRVVFAGVTDGRGVLKIEKSLMTATDEYTSYYTREFAVFAFKGADKAYIMNDWTDGLEPWQFDVPYVWNINEAGRTLGIVFTDRGVYKLGEEVRFKAILRKKDRGNMVLFPEGTEAELVVTDGRGKQREKRTVRLSSMSSFDGAFTVGREWPLGYCEVAVKIGNEKVYGSFLLAAYRKPEFRVAVDLSLSSDKGSAEARVSSNYLFGAPLAGGEVKYRYEERGSYKLPREVLDRYAFGEWQMCPSWWDRRHEEQANVDKEGEGKLDGNGELKLPFPVAAAAAAREISLEAQVTDVTRQAITGRATMTAFPDYFVGIYCGDWSFKSHKEGLRTKVVLVDGKGQPVAGADIELELCKMVWKSSQYATGYAYYDWESSLEFETVSRKTVVSGASPVEAAFDIPSGGEYLLRAKYRNGGRTYASGEAWWFYGEGYTPWERYSSNKIDLVAEKKSYRIGDTARIMVQSPWENASMLVTKERETIRDYRVTRLTSTQQLVEVPITADDVPNIFVSVLLLKGRGTEDERDKPAVKVGYCKISVEDERAALKVEVSTDREEYRPADRAKVKAVVKDASGSPVKGAEVTLWAVDVGVLTLTSYVTPDPLKTFYAERSLSVFNADSREKLITARVSVPKGEDEGGGGGMEYGRADQVRKDFRVLAFWVGSALTGDDGSFEGEFLLPESLTAFRVMAVAHTRDNRFGKADREFTVSKQLVLTPAFPRFFAAGDTANCGVLLNSRIDREGEAKVRIESLTPGTLRVEAGEAASVLSPKGKKEFRFKMKAVSPGTARLRVFAEALGETDSFEISIPVNFPKNSRTWSTGGRFDREAKVAGEFPAGAYPGLGELKVEVSQNLLTQLSQSYEFVVEYPYGCAEQRSSRLTVLLNGYKFARSSGRLEGKGDKAREVISKGIRELEPFQRGDGGFGVWTGDGSSLPYLTAYICALMTDAAGEELLEDREMLDRALTYLEDAGAALRTDGEGRFETLESLALAAKVLSENGRNADNLLNRLMETLSDLPTVSLCHLWDAARASGKNAVATAAGEAVRNRIVFSGDSAYLPEVRKEGYYYGYWHGESISTAAGLKSFLGNTKDAETQNRLALYLIKLENGPDPYYRNTHRSAYVYDALSAYARSVAGRKDKVRVSCRLNGRELLGVVLGSENNFEAKKSVPLPELAAAATGGQFSLQFSCDPPGEVHYSVKLNWSPSDLLEPAENRGFKVERKYLDFTTKEPRTSFKAGELVEVLLEVTSTGSHANVALVDPIPAGFEVLDGAFATTARRLQNVSSRNNDSYYSEDDWWGWWWWRFSGFNHVEKHDDRVFLFGSYMAQGKQKFSYIVRATTPGEFSAAPARCFEMYDESVSGSSGGVLVKVLDGDRK